MVALAQTSRLEGMGNLQSDFVKDYTSMFSYPSQVSSVGNMVYGEIGNNYFTGGTPADRGMGAVLGNLWEGRLGTWAIHLHETTPQIGRGDATSGTGVGNGSDPNFNSNESFDLMWGKKMGTATVGARLNRSFWGREVNTPTVTTKLAFDPSAGSPNGRNLSRNIIGFGGGVGFELNPNTNIDIGLLYQNRTFEQTTSPIGANTNEKEDSPTTYVLSGRAMWQWQSNIMVTPVFKWYSFDLSRQTVTGATTTSFSNTLKGWQIGAAGNWSVGSNDLFVLGLTFAQNKVEQDELLFGGPLGVDDKEITETLSPLVFAALETHVNSWLTLRFGANKAAFSKIKGDPRVATDPRVEITTTSFDMTLGAGVKVGTLQFDAVVANDFYSNLGWLGSGQTSSTTGNGGYFPKVTATYSF
ncbi:MAG TPA: hypothetical protein VGK89_01035 [Candidatus Eisenbacteria bacterium]